MYGRGKRLGKPKTRKQSEENIINSTGNPFILKKKKKESKNKIIKDRIIRDIRTLFEEEKEDYYKPKRVNNFGNNIFIEYDSNGDRSSI